MHPIFKAHSMVEIRKQFPIPDFSRYNEKFPISIILFILNFENFDSNFLIFLNQN